MADNLLENLNEFSKQINSVLEKSIEINNKEKTTVSKDISDSKKLLDELFEQQKKEKEKKEDDASENSEDEELDEMIEFLETFFGYTKPTIDNVENLVKTLLNQFDLIKLATDPLMDAVKPITGPIEQFLPIPDISDSIRKQMLKYQTMLNVDEEVLEEAKKKAKEDEKNGTATGIKNKINEKIDKFSDKFDKLEKAFDALYDSWSIMAIDSLLVIVKKVMEVTGVSGPLDIFNVIDAARTLIRAKWNLDSIKTTFTESFRSYENLLGHISDTQAFEYVPVDMQISAVQKTIIEKQTDLSGLNLNGDVLNSAYQIQQCTKVFDDMKKDMVDIFDPRNINKFTDPKYVKNLQKRLQEQFDAAKSDLSVAKEESERAKKAYEEFLKNKNESVKTEMEKTKQ